MRISRSRIIGGLAAFAAGGLATGSQAAPPPISMPSSGDTTVDGQPADAGFLSSLKRSNFLLGDLFGIRRALSPYGVSIAIQETSEVLGNVTGGRRQGADYEGLTQAIVQLDTQRAFNFHGGLLNVSALQVHGRNLSSDNLLTLQTASGIEADRSTRLWELWYQQKLLPEDRLDIRVGQQSIDQEFIFNQNGAYFVNTMFGWPMAPSADLPGGGPAYPLSTLGARFRYRPINALTIMGGVFNGSPSPTNEGDPQKVDSHGVSFHTRGGVLALLEAQYTSPALGGMVYPGQGAPLSHTYRIGAWYDDEHFDDLRVDAQGRSLADPLSEGVPRRHKGQFAVYAVADQMVWRNALNPNQSVSVFGRAISAPQGDRDLIDFSFNGGVVLHAPIIQRLDDTVGLGFGVAHVGSGARGLDGDTAAFAAAAGDTGYYPRQGTETFVEATYQYQFRPWCQIQPDLQYVFNPGGGIANPDAPTKPIGDELVVGVRTNILF